MGNTLFVRIVHDEGEQDTVRSGADHDPTLSEATASARASTLIREELRIAVQYVQRIGKDEAMAGQLFASRRVERQVGNEGRH